MTHTITRFVCELAVYVVRAIGTEVNVILLWSFVTVHGVIFPFRLGYRIGYPLNQVHGALRHVEGNQST